MDTNNHVENKIIAEKSYWLVYVRKSTESEDKQVQSIEDQKKAIDEMVVKNSFKVIKVFEESKSAKKPDNRPEFQKMVDVINKRDDIEGIICWHLDRLSRNPPDMATIQWLLQEGKLNRIATPQKIYTIEDSTVLMSLEGAVANQFIFNLRRSVARGINSKIEKGDAPQSAPVGYKNDTTKPQGARTIISHPEFFPLMRKLFEFFMTNNYSIKSIADKANELGVRNNLGRKISRGQIYRVLRNPFYTGKFKYRGVIYQGNHPPMISEEEHRLIMDIIHGKSKTRPQKPLEFVLNGFVKCKTCGMSICGERHVKHYKNGQTQEFRYYRCTKKGKVKCTEKYIHADKLEHQVTSFLGTIEIESDFADWAIQWTNYLNKQEHVTSDARKRALSQAHRNVSTKISNLLDLKISPENADSSLLSDFDYQERRHKLVGERDEINSQLEEMDKKTDEWDNLTVQTFNFASRARKKYEEGDFETRKLILRAIGSNLTLSNQKLEIQPRNPFLFIKEYLGDSFNNPTPLEPDKNTVYSAIKEHHSDANSLGRG